MHKGQSLSSGHYFSLTKRGNSCWYLCNDSEIRKYDCDSTELTEVMGKYKKKVYIMVYSRREQQVKEGEGGGQNQEIGGEQ